MAAHPTTTMTKVSQTNNCKMPPNKKKQGSKQKTKPVRRVGQAEGETNWEYWLRGGHNLLTRPSAIVNCDHGHSVDTFDVSERQNPIFAMLTSFDSEIASTYGIRSVIKETYNGYESVWDDDEQRMTAFHLFVRIGVNLALYVGLEQRGGVTPYYAAMACMLENYDGNINSTLIKMDAKMRDFTVNCHTDLPLSRVVVKYLAKKSTCGCLNVLYARVKNHPNIGKCKTCEKLMEKKLLLVCSDCKCAHYCSKVSFVISTKSRFLHQPFDSSCTHYFRNVKS